MKGPKGEPLVQKCDRVHRINRQDKAVPGAVSFKGNATHRDRPSILRIASGQFRDSIAVVAEPTVTTHLELHIVAFLAPDNDDQIEEKIAQKVEERLRRHMKEGEFIMAAEVNDGSSTYCGFRNRTLFLFDVLSFLLLIIGGIVGGVLSNSAGAPIVAPTPAPTIPLAPTPAPFNLGPTPVPTLLGKTPVDELRSFNDTSDEDVGLFSDPTSLEFQALEWMQNDAMDKSQDRSKKDFWRQYALARLEIM